MVVISLVRMRAVQMVVVVVMMVVVRRNHKRSNGRALKTLKIATTTTNALPPPSPYTYLPPLSTWNYLPSLSTYAVPRPRHWCRVNESLHTHHEPRLLESVVSYEENSKTHEHKHTTRTARGCRAIQ